MMMMMVKMSMKVAIFHVDSEEKSALIIAILFTMQYNSRYVYCGHYHKYIKITRISKNNIGDDVGIKRMGQNFGKFGKE